MNEYYNLFGIYLKYFKIFLLSTEYINKTNFNL